MIQTVTTTKLIEYKRANKSSADTIDDLINKILSTGDYSCKEIADDKKNKDYKKWIMPEEPKGFMKCKKHDPL
jgi:hypothetical protein